MNLLKKSLVTKLMIASLAFGAGVNSMLAEVKLYIEPFEIKDYEPHKIPVYLEYDPMTDGDMTTLNFDLLVSDKLVIDGIPVKNEGMLGRYMQYSATFGNGDGNKFVGDPTAKEGQRVRVLVTSPTEKPFRQSSGVITNFTIKAKTGALDQDEKLTITLKDVLVCGANGENSWIPESDPTFVSGETTVDTKSEIILSLTEGELVVNPSEQAPIGFSLKNNIEISSMQFDVILPEGFSYDDAELIEGDRLSGSANVTISDIRDNGVRIVINDLMTNKAVTGTEGELFTGFKLIAPESFAESVEISVKNIIVTSVSEKKYKSEPFKIKVVNGAGAKNSLDAEVTKLEENLAAALAEIAEKYESVKDQFTGEEITNSIETLKQEIAAAYEDKTLSSKKEAIMETVKGIQENIDALAPAAAEAVRVAANEAAHKAEIDAIDAAAAKLEAALAKVKEAYPDYNTEADVKAVNDAVAAAKAAADDALKAVEKEGTYNHQLDAKPIEDAIAAIEKNAKADADAKAEAARVAANKAAYEKDLADIKPFESQLAMVLAKVADNKDYDVTADKAAAEKAITDAKEAAAANLAAVKDEGEYKSTLDVAKIAAAITAIEKNAAAATAEAARVAANKAAYDKDVEDLKALQTKLDAAVESVKGNENYDSAADAKAAQDLIDAAKAAADKDFAAVAEEGNYKSTLDAAAIEAAIAAIAKNADDASLQAVNDKAKANADAAVAALKDNLAAAVADIKENCPDVADLFNGEAENAAIAGLESAIAAAYEGKTLAADYDKVMAPAATIEEAIKTLKSEAEAAQKAAEAEAKRVADNKAAYDAEMALIQQLRDELQAEIDKFKENGWENDLFNERKNVSDYIDGLENKVKSENNRVIPSDTYANQLKDSDMEMARGLIKEYVQKVQTSGIDSIVADEELGNARIYTIDGVQHSRLVPGVNIIVKADGTTTKVYVK